ncbi:carnitine 3-dehydrogenase [Sulfitobacter aestuarii]|uniref:L-carnitine dehydrogenase n=1 Tax=Sulfitobacter aestuarii TaxID=2161676 RepID=A0ABW5TYS8_9RHOB
MSKTAAIIGGGVIGGGWAARFALNGWNVQVFDPDPQAERKIAEVMGNARRSMPGLTDVALPEEGTISFHASIVEAVAGASWIQESVPERLDIKHKTFAKVQAACAPDAVIGSSTSGFKPSELQQGAARPEQIMVAHPFNPVYLLPLVELVPGNDNTGLLVEKAMTMLSALGMYPLHLKKEIDAHVADRFLEAVWREALWLVKDGIASTEEIDNAIRYGFGIRWAQMGLFETYRVAGGEAGMKHFMAQFGPCLSWPWTKLMDVPEFTDELVDLIAGQSDAQSGMHSIRELERIRDNNLVTMMRGLKTQDWGAGALMNAHEKQMRAGTVLAARADEIEDPAAPVLTVHRAVPLDWVDYNGHMNEARYLHAFGDATDRFMEMIGCDAAYIASGGSYFTAETHIRHLDEAHAGDVIEVTTRVLAGAGKKMHLWHEMRIGERLVATGEHFLLHVSLATRKPSAPSPEIEAALARFAQAQATLPQPDGAGRAVGAPR